MNNLTTDNDDDVDNDDDNDDGDVGVVRHVE
jgi:hypothetical protein